MTVKDFESSMERIGCDDDFFLMDDGGMQVQENGQPMGL
jgi:hypothetical protein